MNKQPDYSGGLSPEQETAIKWLASSDLISFCCLTNPEYDPIWYHELIAEKLQNALERAVKGEKSRIILELPPRHGKSELATVNFPAWALGKYPKIPIIVCSYNSDLAVEFGQKTRDLMLNDNYKAIFKTRLRQDSKAKERWFSQENGYYVSTGVGGAITGKGFKVGIIDDPFKNRQEADSETYRDNVYDFYKSTFYTRQEGEGAIILIMTRWHTDDLVGRLLEKQEEDERAGNLNYDKWEVVRFPAIAEEDEPHRKKGEALWERKFPISTLKNIENSLGIYEFSALYQQNPIPSENQEFRKEWFRYFEESDLKDKDFRYTTTVDPAVGKDQDADNSVILTCGKEPEKPNIYRIEETAGHFDPLKLIDAIFYHQKKYRSEVFIETVAYQKALKYFIEEEQRKRGQYFVVNELKANNSQSKPVRIRGLVPLYGAGVVYHRRSDGQYEQEALSFPFGKRDDRLDAMASQLEAMENTRKKNSFKQSPWKPLSEFEGGYVPVELPSFVAFGGLNVPEASKKEDNKPVFRQAEHEPMSEYGG